MKIALIGTGKMGRIVEMLANERKHEISRAIDSPEAALNADELAKLLTGTDVAVDFSTASAVKRNVEACVAAGVPLVEGTTGWHDERDAIERLVRDGNGAFV